MDFASLVLAQAAENERNGDWTAAELFYRGLLRERPEHPQATLALGLLLRHHGDPTESLLLLKRAAALAPDSPDAAFQLGEALQAAGQHEQAKLALLIAACLRAIAINPNDIETRFHLGLAFHQAGHATEAAQAFRQALALGPNFAELHNNLGICLQTLRRNDEAAVSHRRAVALAPWNAGHHCNLAHALLASGQLREGLAEWEWRTPSPPRDFSQPKWDGAPFPGQTLLAHAEQGYGDTLQFCRFLTQAAERGGRLIVECRAPVAGLLERMAGVAEVVVWGTALPPFDLQITIPSLAHALGATPTSVPSPYLKIDDDRLIRWRRRIDDCRFKVGLVWAGNAAGLDPHRAIPPACLRHLSALPDVALYSLQRDTKDQTALPDSVVNLGSEITDFDDLAAAIGCLDLLISVDTAAAHLAGALGKPVWTLLHAAPDWRWQGGKDLDDQDSEQGGVTPWYPTMRLYRQQANNDWDEVIVRVATRLIAIAGRA
ncbi:tetratricopeptide repeat protein [Telmatospirillum sp.]|uniref:tetratricopeptide repeat protein n=1 Tax=Telmatospirillum sp. TaxID=2079197 RepID=UPI0028416ADC|nr:tetratricopeptide repeat protein [Telmatospirillum sp.]MDR3440793.1 tetratricopeptide repeat protein [Telmatospirillum sp.]